MFFLVMGKRQCKNNNNNNNNNNNKGGGGEGWCCRLWEKWTFLATPLMTFNAIAFSKR